MQAKRRIYIVIILTSLMLALFQLLRIDILLLADQSALILESPRFTGRITRIESNELDNYKKYQCLLIDNGSVDITSNIAAALKTLKIDYTVIPAAESYDDYGAYDLIILPEIKRSKLVDYDHIKAYVEEGGGILYLENGSIGRQGLLTADSAFWGINKLGRVGETNAINFITELLSGITGYYMIPYTNFISLDVSLDDDCYVHLETGSENPLIWEKDQLNGKVIVMNTGHYDGKDIRGLLAGSIAMLLDPLIYPVIGSEVVFIDDFPADYRSAHDVLRRQYGRDLQRFVLEIWWPDMLGLMRKYDLKYTGAYVESYDDYVNGPFNDNTEIGTCLVKLVNDLIMNKGEVCLHGYNHQPLSYRQNRMSLHGYKAWPDEDHLIAALEQSCRFFGLFYPQYRFNTYIPPSNMLDPDAIPALLQAVPSINVISGIYYPDKIKYNPDIFCQEFGVDDQYGIALPRVSSGAFLTDEVRYLIASVMTTNGIISHFIYLYDIIDLGHSEGLSWTELYDEYNQLFAGLRDSYGWLSQDTATSAAKKIEQVDLADIYFSVKNDTLTIACDQFTGSLLLMVTTGDKLTAFSGCTVQKIDSIRYLVTMQESIVSLEVGEP